METPASPRPIRPQERPSSCLLRQRVVLLRLASQQPSSVSCCCLRPFCKPQWSRLDGPIRRPNTTAPRLLSFGHRLMGDDLVFDLVVGRLRDDFFGYEIALGAIR